jgi:serine/threonine-protein kinase
MIIMMATPPAFQPPASVGGGRYQIHELLGTGGVGAVFRASDTRTGDSLAVKILNPALVATKIERRFLREAKVMRSLRHPNIVQVTDVGRDRQHVWFAMELMDRGTCHRLTKERGGLPVSWCLHVADNVLAGLQRIHSAGWVHRDIKPGNLLMDNHGRVKIGDFGILRDEGSELTVPGTSLGTSAYMAPEQHIDATQVTPRSDIYGLGASLFALSTCRLPKQLAAHAVRTQWRVDSGQAARDNGPWHLIPRPLRPLIRRACAWNPEDRFRDATDMRRAVREITQAIRQREAAERRARHAARSAPELERTVELEDPTTSAA